MQHTPELLAPAGDPEKLAVVLRYGADAVYLSGSSLSLRAGCGGFDRDALVRAAADCRAAGTRLYYALNILAREEHLPGAEAELDMLAGLPEPVDGVIIADPGLVALALERVPHIPIHLSTQANTANSAAARFWRDVGVKRVNLARELDCKGLKRVVHESPDLETEVFVHGAMCMALSGRCLMSAYLNDRSANLGRCTHPCRFRYASCPGEGVGLEEATRPGAPVWELSQEAGHAAVLAAEDLCLAPFLAWFGKAGITAVKIEGRTKAPGYLAVAVDVYATALRDLREGRFRPALYMAELSGAASRPMGTGFFLPGGRRTIWPAAGTRRPLLARVMGPAPGGGWELLVMHRWDGGAMVEIVAPGLERPLLGSYGLEKETGEALATAHSGLRAVLRADHPALAPQVFLRQAPEQLNSPSLSMVSST